MERNVARLRVSAELLRHVLGLPEGTEIRNARGAFDYFGDVELLVEHPDLKAVPEGDEIPHANPVFRMEIAEDGTRTVHLTTWGQK